MQKSEEQENIIVTSQEAGERIDKILAQRYAEVRSRTYFQFLIESGCVLLNGARVKKREKPVEGDEIEVQFILTPELDLQPENIPLNIIYEDADILVVNKPSGMVVHPAPGNWSGTFVNALLYHCKAVGDAFGDAMVRPGIVHRLDKDTSGVLVAAKTVLAHQRLVEMFTGRHIYKEYWAVCVGNPGSGTINAAIGRHPIHRKMMAVVEEGGKEAITQFEVLGNDSKLSLVKVVLMTGRTHQIRVHMRHRGTPVLGDSVYGQTQANERFKAGRQLLHAHEMRFKHPISGVEMTFSAPLPADMASYADFLIKKEG